jgi:hypothetical protein
LEASGVEPPFGEGHVVEEGAQPVAVGVAVVGDQVEVVALPGGEHPIDEIAEAHRAAERGGVEVVVGVALPAEGGHDLHVAEALLQVRRGPAPEGRPRGDHVGEHHRGVGGVVAIEEALGVEARDALDGARERAGRVELLVEPGDEVQAAGGAHVALRREEGRRGADGAELGVDLRAGHAVTKQRREQLVEGSAREEVVSDPELPVGREGERSGGASARTPSAGWTESTHGP